MFVRFLVAGSFLFFMSRRCLVLHDLNKSAPGIGVTRVSKLGWDG
ncbi:unnamed protein product [Musa hybrid cultivar]